MENVFLTFHSAEKNNRTPSLHTAPSLGLINSLERTGGNGITGSMGMPGPRDLLVFLNVIPSQAAPPESLLLCGRVSSQSIFTAYTGPNILLEIEAIYIFSVYHPIFIFYS